MSAVLRPSLPRRRLVLEGRCGQGNDDHEGQEQQQNQAKRKALYDRPAADRRARDAALSEVMLTVCWRHSA